MTETSAGIEQFLKGQQKLSVPFDLTINGKTYICTDVLRLLPGKRLVVKAKNDSQKLVIKLFSLSKKGKRELARENQGHQLATQAGVNLPELIFSVDEPAGCCAIAYQYIENAVPFPNKNKMLAKHVDELLHLVATLHNAGVFQSDFHLGNVLIADNSLYLIDLASVENNKGSESLSKRQSLTNLATLSVQFKPKQQQVLIHRLQQYYLARGWEFYKQEQDQFTNYINKAWQKRKTIYLKKRFRNCTMTAYRKSFYQEYGFRRSFFDKVGKEFINEIDNLVSNGTVLKDGNSTTVSQVNYAGKKLVIKRYNIKGFWHFLRRCYRPSRAAVSWRNGNLLQLLGIATPKPLGFVEQRFGPFRKVAYLICEHSKGRELSAVFNGRDPSEDELSRLKDIFLILNSYQISHGDLKATNLLLTKKGKFHLIDLDVMQEHSNDRSYHSAFNKDKYRFIKNWKNMKTKQLFESLFLTRF
jgi:tRNA A-37 threonylcarbamoyl transferase component Bud32